MMNYHDALAKLGVGTAHPGGIQTTQAWTERIHWDSLNRVLEIGCGTGRTACLLAKQHDHLRVVGVDIRELMIDKARKRARLHKLDDRVLFVATDAHQLPFEDHTFDLIYMESVGVFMDTNRLYQEVARVVKPGGTVVAIEMMDLLGIPRQLMSLIHDFYGARQVPTFEGWKQILQRAGFENVHALQTMQLHVQLSDNSDPDQAITVQSDEWQAIHNVQETNAYLLQMCAPFLGYVVLRAEKPKQ
jgi:ubiquinone/menaquinone biosynthesis C-methylase UbiE